MTAQAVSPPTRIPLLPQDLAELRTVMAADRTLMAWVRTALAMLSFGFTIYKFLDGVRSAKQAVSTNTPQFVGLFLVGMGMLSIIMGTVEYGVTLRDLNKMDRFRLGRPALLMALLLSLAGAALFFAIAFRVA